MEPNIPLDLPQGAPLARAQARVQGRVDELLEALRPQTASLRPDADSALTFRPDIEQPE